MEEMALFAAGPVVGKHRRHHPLFPVLFGAGAAFGTARRLAARYVQDFRSTGTSHLLAISGLHVGVLVVMFLAASAWLFGRRGFYFFAFPFIAVWAYVLVSGMPPSVVRAAVMGSVYLPAVGVDRPGSILPALAFSAGLMTIISPKIVQRVSFQLSFVAMAGIASTQPFIPRWPPESGIARPILVGVIGVTDGPRALDDAHNLVVGHAGDLAVAGLQLPRGDPTRDHRYGVGGRGSRQHDRRAIHRLDGLGAHKLSDRTGRSRPEMDSPSRLGRQLAGGLWYLALGVLLLFLKPGRLGWLWSWVKDRAGELTRHPMGPAKTLPVIMGAVIMTAAAVALWWQVGTAATATCMCISSTLARETAWTWW